MAKDLSRVKKLTNRIANRPLNPHEICTQNKDPDGFVKRYINKEVGYGVFTTRRFNQGSALLEYKGNLCSAFEGKIRLENNEKRQLGSFVFFFKSNGKRKCIDATLNSCLARWVNDSPDQYANCKMKRVSINYKDHLYLEAKFDIPENEELRYDYLEKDLEWRKEGKHIFPCVFDPRANIVCPGDSNTKGSVVNLDVLRIDVARLRPPFLIVTDFRKQYRPLHYCGKFKIDTYLPDDKQKSQNSSSEKFKKGYCEICISNYKDLEKHLESQSHKDFAKNNDNYQDVDMVINKMCPFEDFLNRVKLDPFEEQASVDTLVSNKSPIEEQVSVDTLVSDESPIEEQVSVDTLISSKSPIEEQASVDTLNSNKSNKSPIEEQALVDTLVRNKNPIEEQASVDTLVSNESPIEEQASVDTLVSNESPIEEQATVDTLVSNESPIEEQASVDTLVSNKSPIEEQVSVDTLVSNESPIEEQASVDTLVSKESLIEEQASMDTLYRNKSPIEEQASVDTLVSDESPIEEQASVDTLVSNRSPIEEQASVDTLVSNRSPIEEQASVDTLVSNESPIAEEVSVDTLRNEKRNIGSKSAVSKSQVSCGARKRPSPDTNCVKKRSGESRKTPHKCPKDGCGVYRTDLPKHMRTIHGWADDRAKNVVNTYGLRKIRERKSTSNPIRKRKLCSYPGCYAAVRYLGSHLKTKHYIEPNTKQWFELKRKAKFHPADIKSNSGVCLSKRTLYDNENSVMSPPPVLPLLKSVSQMATHTSRLTNNSNIFKTSIIELTRAVQSLTGVLEQTKPAPSFTKSFEENSEPIFQNFEKSMDNGNYLNADKSIEILESDYHKNETYATNQVIGSTNPNKSKYKLRVQVEQTHSNERHSSDCDSSEFEDTDDVPYDPLNDENEIDFIRGGNLNPTSSLKVLINKFEEHLLCENGGEKEQRNAKYTSREVERIALALNATSIEDLLESQNIREKYLHLYCQKKNHQPSSIQKYLRSLRDFYEFLLAAQIRTTKSIAHIHALKSICTGWIKKYGKLAKQNHWKREEKDLLSMVSAEDVRTYENSIYAQEARELFSQLIKDNIEVNLSCDQFCSVRDHLLFKLYFTHSHRPGVYANALLDEFYTATVQPSGKYMFKVFKHKTFETEGAAMIFMVPEVYKMMQAYVTKARIQRDFYKESHLFLTTTGGCFDGTSGGISRRVHNRFELAGVKKIGRITTNIIRKSTVTGMRNKKLGKYEESAVLMAHNIKTAEKNYRLVERSRQGDVGSSAITNFYYPEKANDDLGKVGSMEVSPAQDHSVLKNATTPRKCWTAVEEETLKQVFENEISGDKDVRIDNIRKARYQLGGIDADTTDKQIADKVIRLKTTPQKRRLEDQDDLEEIYEQGEEELSPTSKIIRNVQAKKKRKSIFTDEDTERLLRACLDLVKKQTYPRGIVTARLKGDEILKKYSYLQIRTRLVYLSGHIN